MNNEVLTPKRVRTLHLTEFKQRGQKFAMLTSYDQFTAAIFEEAGIETLLVGDSAANNVYGYANTIPVTLDEMIPLVRAVSGATSRPLIVADLPFGSYESGPEQALASAVRLMKEGGADAVKLEGGERSTPQIRAIVSAGIPVMGHLGFTPQSEHQFGGFRIQGRGSAAEVLLKDAAAVEAAGAFGVVLEMIPGPLAKAVTEQLSIPTIGIGAGAETDGQVLVWTDFAGLTPDPVPRFVKRFANLRADLLAAATEYRAEVVGGSYPDETTSYQS